MSVLYLHLDYEGYKALEDQMRAFRETTHKSTGGFYHKSIRLKVGGDLIVEFHGPLVGGYGHATSEGGACDKRPDCIRDLGHEGECDHPR